MSIETIKKTLEGHEKAEDIVKLINTMLSEMETKGKSEVSKRNKENESIRRRLGKFSEALKGLGLDVEGEEININTIKEKLEGSAPKTELEKLQSQIADLTGKLDQSEKEKRDSKVKTNNEKIKSAILSALTEGKAIKPDKAVRLVLPDVVTENIHMDEYTAGFKVGDQTLPIADGVKQFLKDNPEFVTNTTTPGGGTDPEPGGRGRPDNIQKLDSRRDQLRSMTASTV